MRFTHPTKRESGHDATVDGEESGWPRETFSAMLYRCVEAHEERLDEWQSAHETVRSHPAEARRPGNLEWVRELPGVNARLGPAVAATPETRPGRPT